MYLTMGDWCARYAGFISTQFQMIERVVREIVLPIVDGYIYRCQVAWNTFTRQVERIRLLAVVDLRLLAIVGFRLAVVDLGLLAIMDGSTDTVLLHH